MKHKIIRFGILLCILSVTAFAQVHQTPTGEVKSLMNQQEKSWNRGDIPGFMKHYWKSDSLKFIGSKGITYGWQKTYDNYVKSYPTQEAMGILRFTIIECTQLSPTSIYVIGKWELAKDKPSGGHFTLLWKKIEGKWVIVADHTS
jgi:ketosteroid isomerase-like protein